MVKVFIAASWEKRENVRRLAKAMRIAGYDVYDFTDDSRREIKSVPPEQNPEPFNPESHMDYWRYLNVCRVDLKAAVKENKRKLDECDFVILLLPCGIDATADWTYAMGKGKKCLLVGYPKAGERTAWHFHADKWFPHEAHLMIYMLLFIMRAETEN